MSPMGDAFRNRLRMFPALVNVCTIDWFSDWPAEALASVADATLLEVFLVLDYVNFQVLLCSWQQASMDGSEESKIDHQGLLVKMFQHFHLTVSQQSTVYLQVISSILFPAVVDHWFFFGLAGIASIQLRDSHFLFGVTFAI